MCLEQDACLRQTADRHTCILVVPSPNLPARGPRAPPHRMLFVPCRRLGPHNAMPLPWLPAAGEALEVLGDPMKRQLYDEGFDREAIEDRISRANKAARESDHRHHRH